MVATVKIIPFAVESELTQQVVAEVDVEPVIGLVAAQALNIGLIATPAAKPETIDHGQDSAHSERPSWPVGKHGRGGAAD